MVNCSIHWCYWDEELLQQMSLLIFCNNYRNWCCCEGHKQAITEPLVVCGGSDWKIACDALFRADIWSWKLTQTFNSSALLLLLISLIFFISHSSLERGSGLYAMPGWCYEEQELRIDVWGAMWAGRPQDLLWKFWIWSLLIGKQAPRNRMIILQHCILAVEPRLINLTPAKSVSMSEHHKVY